MTPIVTNGGSTAGLPQEQGRRRLHEQLSRISSRTQLLLATPRGPTSDSVMAGKDKLECIPAGFEVVILDSICVTHMP